MNTNKIMVGMSSFLILMFSLSSKATRVSNLPIKCSQAEEITFSVLPQSLEAELISHGLVDLEATGVLPSGCYSADSLEYFVDKRGDIYIKNNINFSPSQACTMVQIPYAQNIKIAGLADGDHYIFVKNRDGEFVKVNEFRIH